MPDRQTEALPTQLAPRDIGALVVNQGSLPAGSQLDDGAELLERAPQGHDVASGRTQAAAERLGLRNDLVLFNPAPVT